MKPLAAVAVTCEAPRGGVRSVTQLEVSRAARRGAADGAAAHKDAVSVIHVTPW